jgi:hypothetical protein
MESRSFFGVDPERESGMQLVRDRWARLWQALGADMLDHFDKVVARSKSTR